VKSFYFSVDVDWVRGSESGVVGLYDFCERFGIQPTFFVTGQFAVEYSDVVREGAKRGYQVGTHGWQHDEEEDFSRAPIEKQQHWIRQATQAVGGATGVSPDAFRAPNLWVSEVTLRVLEQEGYRIDSSVPSRRLTLGYGRRNSWNQYWAPRTPYYPCTANIGRPGDCDVLEIPTSSYILPINMSALRVLGLKALLWSVRRIRACSPVLVFYAHPAEFVTPSNMDLPTSEPRRHREGIGPKNFQVLEEFVKGVASLGYVSRYMSTALPSTFESAA
jgi:hypothetical protein